MHIKLGTTRRNRVLLGHAAAAAAQRSGAGRFAARYEDEQESLSWAQEMSCAQRHFREAVGITAN